MKRTVRVVVNGAEHERTVEPRLTLADFLREDLRLTGTGEWRAAQPRVVQLRGTAEASAERKDLEPLLQMLGIRGPGIPQPFSWTVPI